MSIVGCHYILLIGSFVKRRVLHVHTAYAETFDEIVEWLSTLPQRSKTSPTSPAFSAEELLRTS